jgi:hypothetical protein
MALKLVPSGAALAPVPPAPTRYVHQEFPKMVYHAEQRPRVVADAAAWLALGPGWGHPADSASMVPESTDDTRGNAGERVEKMRGNAGERGQTRANTRQRGGNTEKVRRSRALRE